MIDLRDLAKAIDSELTDFYKASAELRKEAVMAGAEVAKKALEKASPRKTGEFAQSWDIKPYGDYAYVHNTKMVGKGKKVSLANILEYGAGRKPFIRKTAEAVAGEVAETIKKKIQGG